jgi:hypothetical protein
VADIDRRLAKIIGSDAPDSARLVTVFSQPDLSGDHLIDDAGKIHLPLSSAPLRLARLL